MKKITLFIIFAAIAQTTFSQKIDKIINAKEVARIEGILSADARSQGFYPGN